MPAERPETSRPAIFVTGYMASGKTTFARALARATNREFIDLDFRIEQRFHTSITEIFATKGEDAFRRIETEMLREVAEMENVVIACGGGTPCFNGNMDLMLACGNTVWLDTSPQRMAERLAINRKKRPLLADKSPSELLNAITEDLDRRKPFYSKAEIHFDGGNLEDKKQINDSIDSFLKRHPDI